jgi:ATP-dependent RNA helicase RhlE
MSFKNLGLSGKLLKAVDAQGYTTPTEIQEQAIPAILEGKDLMGCAQTGTGKTAAFAMPTLDRLSKNETKVTGRGRKIRALVLAPTRELAVQIGDSFRVYGRYTKLRRTIIFGGVSQNHQVRDLNNGVDIVVATPGRLIDLINQKHVDLSHVETLILDEADRMLDMGFIHDLRKIIACVPTSRQTLLFSATIEREVRHLASQWLSHPVDLQLTPDTMTVDKIKQSVYFVEQRQKMRLLADWMREASWKRMLVFTRTKHGADKVAKRLQQAGYDADALHSNKSQNQRQRILERFKSPKSLVLVATDIAARGLDINEVSHVVNFDIPIEAENYVHRIGRTGRAGADGIAISFCNNDERSRLRAIERMIQQSVAVEEGRPALFLAQPKSIEDESESNRPPRRNRRQSSRSESKDDSRSKSGSSRGSRPYSKSKSDGDSRDGKPRFKSKFKSKSKTVSSKAKPKSNSSVAASATPTASAAKPKKKRLGRRERAAKRLAIK